MIYLSNLSIQTTTDSIVGNKDHKPFDPIYGLHKTQQELEQTGIFVDSIPKEELIVNKSAILHINPQTKEMWYEYVDIPKTPEQLLEERLSATEIAIANMLGV